MGIEGRVNPQWPCYSPLTVTFIRHYYTLLCNSKQRQDIMNPAQVGGIRLEKRENSAKKRDSWYV